MSKRKKTNGLAGLCLGWKVCVVQGCFAKIPKHAHRNKCAKHHARQWKNNHPLKYAFNKLKNRAKERGKEFNLTFKEYEEFAIKTDYSKLKGRSGLSLSINRKNPSKGYSKNNIEAITLSQNTRLRYAPYWRKELGLDYEPTAADIAAAEKAAME